MNPTARVPVLMYHRIGTAHNDWERKYCVSPHEFEGHMRRLHSAGWRAISLEDFFAWLDGRTDLPTKSFLLTFDDGFLGVWEHAAPVLKLLDWPATVFLVSSLIGRRDEWCAAQNPSGATYPLMNAEQIRDLARNGVTFQSHTRSHVDLSQLSGEALSRELSGARTDLEALLERPVRYLAYPFGRHNDQTMAAARDAGYLAAFSTQPGFNRRDIDRFRLRRVDVFGTDSAPALMRKIKLGSNDGRLANAVRYKAARLFARLSRQRA